MSLLAVGSSSQPSAIGLKLLQLLNGGKSLKEISKSTGLSPGLVGIELAKLELSGHIGPDGRLTLNGKETLGK